MIFLHIPCPALIFSSIFYPCLRWMNSGRTRCIVASTLFSFFLLWFLLHQTMESHHLLLLFDLSFFRPLFTLLSNTGHYTGYITWTCRMPLQTPPTTTNKSFLKFYIYVLWCKNKGLTFFFFFFNTTKYKILALYNNDVI